MTKQICLNKEIDKAKDQIIKELQLGNDIMIKKTPQGIKIQALAIRRVSYE